MPKAVEIEKQIYMALQSLESLNEDTIEFKNQITTLFSQITQKHIGKYVHIPFFFAFSMKITVIKKPQNVAPTF